MSMLPKISSDYPDSTKVCEASWTGGSCGDRFAGWISSSESECGLLDGLLTLVLLFTSCTSSVFGVYFGVLGLVPLLACFYLFLEFWRFRCCACWCWEEGPTGFSALMRCGCAGDDPGVVYRLGGIACTSVKHWLRCIKNWRPRIIAWSKFCSCFATVVAEHWGWLSSTKNVYMFLVKVVISLM